MSDRIKSIYKNLEEDLYDNLTKSANPLRAWFHTGRFEILQKLVAKYYQNGMVIVDMGCGSCNWNINKLNVVGIDISKNMLDVALRNGRLKKALNEDITKNSLKNNFADIIILGDVLEHILNYGDAIKEAERILKRRGIIFCSVPYDTIFSSWWWLFNPYCLVVGYIFGSKHHKLFGGHINHFSPNKIKREIERHGLRVIKQFNNMRFTIYTIAIKD